MIIYPLAHRLRISKVYKLTVNARQYSNRYLSFMGDASSNIQAGDLSLIEMNLIRQINKPHEPQPRSPRRERWSRTWEKSSETQQRGPNYRLRTSWSVVRATRSSISSTIFPLMHNHNSIHYPSTPYKSRFADLIDRRIPCQHRFTSNTRRTGFREIHCCDNKSNKWYCTPLPHSFLTKRQRLRTWNSGQYN